jgi:hypothetical protein
MIGSVCIVKIAGQIHPNRKKNMCRTGTVRTMSEDESREIATAVASLARDNAGMAGDAAATLSWITCGESPASISQERIQNFCWQDLPVHWDSGFHRGLQVTEALARALNVLRMPRYAAICRSETTRQVLAAYQAGLGRGRAAFRRAAVASGIVPPDLPDLEWGVRMGLAEASAWSSTANRLELAVASGALLPGARGWKTHQRRLTHEYLDSQCADGQTLGQAIIAERTEIWACSRRSTTRMAILSGLRSRLLEPEGLPAAGADPLSRLRWLLEEVHDGVPLTRAGYLDPQVVLRGASRFECTRPSPPRTEAQVAELYQVRRFAQRLGLARRSGRSLVLTVAGRRLRTQPEGLWRHTAAKLISGTDFITFTGELFLALAISERTLSAHDMCVTVAEAVREEDFRERRTGESPSGEDIRCALSHTTGPMRALELFSYGNGRGHKLTPAGEAMALAALRSRATGPAAVPR